jgi:hypothetical protein
MVVPLTSSKTTLKNKIDDIRARGGTGTNVCQAVKKGEEVIWGAGHHTEENTRRFFVLLSDGDNTYNAASYQTSTTNPAGDDSPIPPCVPDTSPWNSDGDVSSSCSSAQTREVELDEKTYDLVLDMKADDIEFYVVGFGVCGSPPAGNPTCDTSLIGSSLHDNSNDRNLLKCIASSNLGTNDHYYEVATADDLPEVFEEIARQIGHRLIE